MNKKIEEILRSPEISPLIESAISTRVVDNGVNLVAVVDVSMERLSEAVRLTVIELACSRARRIKAGGRGMILYHATTQKKARLYRETGAIKSPVRGFTTPTAAMAWAMKVNRTVIIEFEATRPHKLPDHHNQFGEAWWNDGDVTEWRCLFSANGDA